MILKRGVGAGGERVLREKTVALMSANGTGRIPAGRLKTFRPTLSSDVDFHPGHDDRYTLGFLMNPQAVPGARAAGSLAWAGISNTYYWIDPHRSVCGVERFSARRLFPANVTTMPLERDAVEIQVRS
jgi:CubicO group peptidase (beta-lactamase class C family)